MVIDGVIVATHLNGQPGFDDHKYIWKCTECVHKNSV